MFFVGSLVPTFFLDRMGRRRPMMWGSLGLALSMMMISVLLSFQRPAGESTPLSTKTAEASVAFFFTYMLIFGATANCIPWVYVPEILPLHARAKGTAVGVSSNWLWNFFVVMVTRKYCPMADTVNPSANLINSNASQQPHVERLSHIHGFELLVHSARLLCKDQSTI